jgi:APA family basic amino acid/polyamine antiporter
MAKEKVFPAIIGKIHLKTKTPWVAVIVILITSMAFTLIGDIVIVANITVFAIVITFAAVNLAVIVLRYTEPDIERKFKVPINIGKFPILPLFGLGISVYMAFQFEIEVVLVGIAIIGIGAVFYKISKNSRLKSQ